jgi:hypothetical protein
MVSSTVTNDFNTNNVIYAAAAGVLAVGVTHPLDTWVVHRQTGRQLPSLEPRVLYRGVVPALAQASIIYGAMLGSYELLRKDYKMSVVVAAALSAIPESIVKGPLEAAKNLKQTKQPLPPILSTAALRLCGIAFVTCLAREVPGNMAYFYCYEESRHLGLSPALSGGAAATGFTLCSYPLETLRAQMVTGARKELTWRGVGPYWLRGVAVTACLFSSYEYFNTETALGKS